MVVQSLSSGIGQSFQPIISINYGAGEKVRVRQFFVRGLAAAGTLTAIIVLVCMLLPEQLIRAFMDPTEDVLAIGPGYMRSYFLAFVFMLFNIYATYYLQAVMRPWLSVAVSLSRSLVLSGGLILILPPLAGAWTVWWVMPIAEEVTAVIAAVILILCLSGKLKERDGAAKIPQS